MNLKVNCKKCGKPTILNCESENLMFRKQHSLVLTGKKLLLTCFDCKECGERNFLQIDDDSSLEKLKSVEEQMRTLMVRRRKNKMISEARKNKFSDSRQDLAKYRDELKGLFNHMTVIDDETEKTYVFTITKTE